MVKELSMSPDLLKSIFDANVPDDFQQRTLQLLFQVSSAFFATASNWEISS